MTVYIDAAYAQVPGCCGVKELFGFSHDDCDDGPDIQGVGETEAAAADDFVRKIQGRDYIYAAACQMWFVKYKKWDGGFQDHYERETLRQRVAQIPGVIDLGEYVNPNSGNMIQGYLWKVNKV